MFHGLVIVCLQNSEIALFFVGCNYNSTDENDTMRIVE